MSDEWQAAQHADECKLQEDIGKALDTAATRPLTQDEIALLSWASGVSRDFNTGDKNEIQR
jgi:hypothetical protein